ncbi:MAG TPA: glycosyltransferase [Candidatus Limnocylindria bacterium]|nr:glycosyltransferase [Candidatus Limnocylindria bacterium]
MTGGGSKTGGVLVLSAAAGAGHVRSAEALATAFTAKGIAVKHLEVLKYASGFFKKVYSDLYVELVNRQPAILGLVYDALDRPWMYTKRRLALDRLNTRPLAKLLLEERPRLAVCIHFLPAEILLHLRRKKILDIPVGVVITDFDLHAMWLYRGVDWYFVACEETKVHMAALGVPPKTIYVTGIPIDPAFTPAREKAETRRALGLRPDLATVLVSAGGFGMGPVESLANALQEVSHPIQVAVVCGKNVALKRRLEELPTPTHPVKIVGFTTEMERWMAASDLLVGKAGGLTSSEALASGLVMVIVNPIPGQEERNSDHLLEEGVAIRCNNLPALAYKIDSLLSDKKRFERMRQAVRRLARPNAAADVVSLVSGTISSPKGPSPATGTNRSPKGAAGSPSGSGSPA